MEPRSKSRRPPERACRGSGTLIAFLWVGCLIALAGHGVRHGDATVTPVSPADVIAPGGVIFMLGGPNDGEPINARSVELRVSTNYRDQALVSVYANGHYLSSRSVHAGAVQDPESGLLSSTIRLNIEDLLGVADEGARTGIVGVRVRAYLYSSASARLVAYDEWKAEIQRPWMQFPTREATFAGVILPPGKVPVVLRLLEGDVHYFLLASHRRESLTLSPQNPAALRDTLVLAGSNCRVDATSPSRGQRLVCVDARPPGAVPLLLVLWTYDPVRGWKRSGIEELPAR